MIYAVIDTNVIVSALITKSQNSPVLQVIQRIFSGSVCILVNKEILAEYREVLARPKFGLERDSIETVISELLKHSLDVDAPPSGITLPDPKDIVFYNVVLAKRDNGAFLVTGNTKHFPICKFVVTPREFLEIIDTPLHTMNVNDCWKKYRP
jgi:putative PIN family toxin of toxin-antitoxin system